MYALGVQAAAEEIVQVDVPPTVKTHAVTVALDAAVIALMAAAAPATVVVQAHRRREYGQTND